MRLGESSTRMGDLLGSPRVAFLFFFDFGRFDSQTVVNILRASSHSSIRNQRGRARRGGKTFARGRGAGPTCGFSTSRYRDNRKDGRLYVGCDHASTKAPDPIRTPKLSVLGRE